MISRPYRHSMIKSRKPIRDVNQVNVNHDIAIGLTSGLAVLFAIEIPRVLGLTRVDLINILGTLIYSADNPLAMSAGFLIFMAVAALSVFGYTMIFRSARRSGPLLGMCLGLIHYAISGILIGMLPRIHPLIPALISPPGFFLAASGLSDFMGFLLGHLAYGALVGKLFDWTATRAEFPAPMVPTVKSRRIARH